MIRKHNIGIILATLIIALALPHTANASAKSHQQSAYRNMKSGDELIKYKDYVNAEKSYGNAIEDLHWIRMNCLDSSTRLSGCRLKIRGKELMHRLLAVSYTSRSVSRLLQRKISGAESDAKTALRWNKDNSKAHWVLGIIAYGQNNMSKARKHYKIVLKLYPRMAAKMLRDMPKLR